VGGYYSTLGGLAMSKYKLMYLCEECQAYVYNNEDWHCAICDSERE
jgi:hypothetical protein